jgi:hypothetical protein
MVDIVSSVEAKPKIFKETESPCYTTRTPLHHIRDQDGPANAVPSTTLVLLNQSESQIRVVQTTLNRTFLHRCPVQCSPQCEHVPQHQPSQVPDSLNSFHREQISRKQLYDHLSARAQIRTGFKH